jgi:hypothetical protein
MTGLSARLATPTNETALVVLVRCDIETEILLERACDGAAYRVQLPVEASAISTIVDCCKRAMHGWRLQRARARPIERYVRTQGDFEVGTRRS